MKAVNPYLNFPGNAEEAFTFYRSVFGGEFAMLQRFGDTPAAEHVPAADRKRIMHIALPLANGSVLMASDACGPMGSNLIIGNNNYISVATDSEAETDKLFAGLSAGGRIEMAPQKMFWGAYFTSFADRFGVQWMLNHEYPR